MPEMHFIFVKRSLHPTRIVSTKKSCEAQIWIKTSSVHDHTPISSQPARDDINAGASAGAAHAGQQVLGVAELVCSSATVGCLMPQGSTGYVAAPPALRTTGALRGVRIDLLIGNNTLPTWAGASRALARLALSHLVTYPLKINLRSSQLASPQVPSLNRLLA